MSRIQETPLLPTNSLPELVRQLTDLHRLMATQVNQLTEGRLTAVQNADTAAPTAGDFLQGDFVRNSTPAELGAPGAKYVIFGWANTVSGSPGTFVECRFLTGA